MIDIIDRMQLDLIETFLDLLESRSFHLTAERLGITQSTVSTRIRSLEQELGSTLFQRGRSGAQPTAAGRRFEDYARAIKSSWSLARQELGALDRHDGALRIACTVSLADSLLADWMDSILAAHPRTALHVEADYSPQMIADIAFGNLDLGILYAPRYLPEIQFDLLMRQRFVLVSSTVQLLKDVAVSDYIRAAYTPALEKAHSELLPELSRPQLSVGLDMIGIGRLMRRGGSSYVPQHMTAVLATRGLSQVKDAPLLEQPVYLASHIRRRNDPLVKDAVRLLLRLVAKGQYGS